MEEASDPYPTNDVAAAQYAQNMKKLPLPERLLGGNGGGGGVAIVRNGDLFRGADIVLHCANCFNTMSAGIAATIARRHPEAYEADCATRAGDIAKLGTFTSAKCFRRMEGRDFVVVNVYGQYRYGRAATRQCCYKALRLGLERFLEALRNSGCAGTAVINTYYMGCFRAGGNVAVVRRIFEKVFNGSGYTLNVFIDDQSLASLPPAEAVAAVAQTLPVLPPDNLRNKVFIPAFD